MMKKARWIVIIIAVWMVGAGVFLAYHTPVPEVDPFGVRPWAERRYKQQWAQPVCHFRENMDLEKVGVYHFYPGGEPRLEVAWLGGKSVAAINHVNLAREGASGDDGGLRLEVEQSEWLSADEALAKLGEDVRIPDLLLPNSFVGKVSLNARGEEFPIPLRSVSVFDDNSKVDIGVSDEHGVELTMISKGKLEAMIEFSMGPKEVARCPLVAGEVATPVNGDWSCQVFYVEPGIAHRPTDDSLRGRSWRVTADSEQCFALLVMSKPIPTGDIEVICRTESGEAVPATVLESQDQLFAVQFEAGVSEVSEIELRVFPKRYRTKVELDPPKGLPERTSFTDLMDYRIPSIRFERVEDLLFMLELYLQVEIRFDAEFPDGFFPREYKDVTVRELFRIYARYAPEHYSYDPVEFTFSGVERRGWVHDLQTWFADLW